MCTELRMQIYLRDVTGVTQCDAILVVELIIVNNKETGFHKYKVR